jgi:polyamine oxidase
MRFKFLFDRNSIHDAQDYKETFKAFKKIEEKILEENAKNPRKEDLPLSSVLAANGWLPDTPLKRTVDWYLDFEYAVKPALMSTRHYTGVPEENDFVTDSRGFKGIVDYLVQNFTGKIKTDKVVTQINYKSSGIEVRTENGDLYTAKYGLCTFSTGVLALDSVKFVPELPQWKIEAISRIPLAYYTNIYVKFPRVFWEDNEFIYNAGSIDETFPLVLNLDKKGIFEDSKLLLFTALEENSLRIEKQDENETKAEVMETLRKMYPNIKVPEPTGITHSFRRT